MMRYDAAISSQDPYLSTEGGAAVCCDLLQHLMKGVQRALLQLCAKVMSIAKFSCPRWWGQFKNIVRTLFLNTHEVKLACLRAREHAEDRCYVLSHAWIYFIEKYDSGD